MITVDIPSWCRSVEIRESNVVQGEVEVWLRGEIEGSPLLVYGNHISKFWIEVVGERKKAQG